MTAFDTLKYSKALRATGVPADQADAQAEVLSDALAGSLADLATKADLALVRSDLTLLRTELKADLAQVEQRLSARMETLDVKIAGSFSFLRWMGGAIVVIFGGILVRLFFMH